MADQVSTSENPAVEVTSAPVSSPAVESPSPVSSRVVQTTAPVSSPVVESSAPVSSPVEQTTAPVSSPVVETSTPVTSPVVETSTPVTSPVVETSTPVSSPVVETTAPVVTPVPVVFVNPPSEESKPPEDAVGLTDAGEKGGYEIEKSTALLSDAKKPDGFDEESSEKKLKYPKSVFFIIVNEFCERFSFYGLRTLLAIYMSTILGFSDNSATVIYHVFIMLCYFFPVFGAIIADSLLGKFKTIIYLSVVFAIGNITLTLASTDEATGVPATEISMLGLFLIAIGTGGIKPCVAAFGGDQFVVPQQQAQLERFFSIYYFTINSGSFISTFITPILREDVHCLGTDSCYPLAFGVPAILMITSIVVFLMGKRFYVMKKPSGNIIVEIFKVIWHAICRKRKSKEKKEHWLDFAEEKYGRKSVHDIKLLLRVLFLYLPLPVFWALYDQQGSRWTFQATRMNGAIGSVSIKAEQLQVVNPLLILAFVPLFDIAVYPLLAKCNLLTKPLHRLGLGGVLAGVAFVLSAFVELALEPTYAVVPKAGNGQMRFYNGLDCPVIITSELMESEEHLKALGLWELKGIPVGGSVDKSFRVALEDPSCGAYGDFIGSVTVEERKAKSHLITSRGGNIQVFNNIIDDNVDKTSNGNPKIRIIYNLIEPVTPRELLLKGAGKTFTFTLNETFSGTDYEAVDIAQYEASINNKVLSSVNLEVGGVYSLLVRESAVDTYESSELFTITNPNSVHMLWLMPQYIVMTAGEVMYSVTGVQFSFTQAPVSMKAVIQAAWLITIAVGNLVVVIIAEARIFDRQIFEFLLFAGLMFIDMIIFGIMAWNYKYIDLKEEEELNQLAEFHPKSANDKGSENKAFDGDQEK